VIVSLREKMEAIRRAEVERAFRKLPAASPETRLAMETMTTRLLNKVLHAPVVTLQASSREGRTDVVARVAQLFGLSESRPAAG
jgi:glutamyl-tRNA reductase